MDVKIGEVVSELALQRVAAPSDMVGGAAGEAERGIQEPDVEDLVERVVRRVLERLRLEWEY